MELTERDAVLIFKLQLVSSCGYVAGRERLVNVQWKCRYGRQGGQGVWILRENFF